MRLEILQQGNQEILCNLGQLGKVVVRSDGALLSPKFESDSGSSRCVEGCWEGPRSHPDGPGIEGWVSPNS